MAIYINIIRLFPQEDYIIKKILTKQTFCGFHMLYSVIYNFYVTYCTVQLFLNSEHTVKANQNLVA